MGALLKAIATLAAININSYYAERKQN